MTMHFRQFHDPESRSFRTSCLASDSLIGHFRSQSWGGRSSWSGGWTVGCMEWLEA